jgi:outer membrane protein TolC
VTFAESVRQNTIRVLSAGEAASLYRAAVGDEWEKLQIGLSTIVDLILTEDRLTQSLLDEIDARLNYATAVARLRFETGTLVGDSGSDRPDPARAVDLERLTRAPSPPR